MRAFAPAVFVCVWAGMSVTSIAVCEEKVLMYDENRGIIFVDKNGKPEQDRPARQKTPREAGGAEAQKRTAAQTRTMGGLDIHVGRRKDPPELYFKSGLQYFKNGDYMNALKNFTYAHTADPKPHYYLWMGKAYRQLEQYDKMMEIMEEIRNKYPDSDVADDALFEIALYYQKDDDYDMAIQKYTELAEQYPFGVSFADGEEYLEISRRQRQLMRAEMVSALKVLGFEGATIADAYREFQKKNGLPADGRPTKETVRAIKAKYQQKLQYDARQTEQKEHIRAGMIVALVAAAVLGLNLWILLAVRAKMLQRRRLLVNLQNILNDLDTKKL